MIQETPYSIYLTLRKSAAKSQTSPWIQTQAISALKNELERVIFDSESLANKCKTLDHEKASLTKNLEEEICHSLNIKYELKAAQDALQNVAVRFDALEQNLTKLETENKLQEQKLQEQKLHF